MKLKKLVCGLFLSTALAAGVGISIASQNKDIEKVEAAASLVGGQNVFLKVDNSNWTQANAAFALYCFGSSGDAWAWFDSATSLSGSYRVATVPSGTWTGLIICRMNPNGSDPTNDYLNWNNKWNKTGDITVTTNDTYTITGTGWDNPSYTQAVFSSKYAFNVSHSDQTDGTWTSTSTVSLTYRNDSEGAQFYNTSVSLLTGMKFDVVRSTDNAWFHSDYLEDGGAVGDYFQKNGTGDASVKNGGTFEFYVKVKNNTVWTQVSSATEADTYASTFMSTITCTNTSVTSPLNAWNKVGSEQTSMEFKYEQLTNGAKNILKTATPNQSGSNVEKCVAKYDRILYKYGYGEGDNQYHDFMSRKPATIVSGAITVNGALNNSTGSVTAIIAITSVSLLAIGGYFLFKKKHN